MHGYNTILDDEIFKSGGYRGRLKTALTVLTDMLIELNALELYYQKPVSKSVTPIELATLRQKIAAVKELIHASLQVES